MRAVNGFKAWAAAVVLLAGGGAAPGVLADHHGTVEREKLNIVESAETMAHLSTLVVAIKAAGLAETLSGPGPYTVFAPTNSAFDKLPAGTLEALLKPENAEQLKSILTFHVVPARATSSAALEMVEEDNGRQTLGTVQGGELTLGVDRDSLVLRDARGNSATVVKADRMQANGVIHLIDTVLMPE